VLEATEASGACWDEARRVLVAESAEAREPN
jgi:hypothetical protein